MKLSGQHNQCPTCGELFNSNAAFDKHRIGTFSATGKTLTRRGMTVSEMKAAGMVKNGGGWWVTCKNSMEWTNAEVVR